MDLGARVGPLTRAKRVRMVRSLHEPDHDVTFERLELDGREHSPWVLAASVLGSDEASMLSMHLHHGGAPPIPFLDQLLAGEARRAAGRLERRLAGGAD